MRLLELALCPPNPSTGHEKVCAISAVSPAPALEAPPDPNLNADGSWGADAPDPFSTEPDVASWHPGHGAHWVSLGGVTRCAACHPPRLAIFAEWWIDLH
jgi:hypothetical protein